MPPRPRMPETGTFIFTYRKTRALFVSHTLVGVEVNDRVYVPDTDTVLKDGSAQDYAEQIGQPDVPRWDGSIGRSDFDAIMRTFKKNRDNKKKPRGPKRPPRRERPNRPKRQQRRDSLPGPVAHIVQSLGGRSKSMRGGDAHLCTVPVEHKGKKVTGEAIINIRGGKVTHIDPARAQGIASGVRNRLAASKLRNSLPSA